MQFLRSCLLLPILGAASVAFAQTPAPKPAGVVRTEGVDEVAGPFVLISLDGHALTGTTPQTPVLIAQCSQRSGKPRFEVFASFGGVAQEELQHFHRDLSGGANAPRISHSNVTLEFLGYVKQKPMKSDWEPLASPVGEFRYLPPGAASHNMGDFTMGLYLRYLLALPTLRLSVMGQPTVEFAATPWMDQVRKEPMCKGSGL